MGFWDERRRKEVDGMGWDVVYRKEELFREKKLGNYGRRSAQDINTLRHNFRRSASQSRLVRA